MVKRRTQRGQGLLEYILIIGTVLLALLIFLGSGGGIKTALEGALESARVKLNEVGVKISLDLGG